MSVQSPTITPETTTPTTSPLQSLPFAPLAFTLFILIYTFFLISHFAPGIPGPDDNGYYAQATLLAKTGHTWFIPESDAQYVGMHWLLIKDSGKYISRYPPGLPVLIAAVYLVAGWKVAVFTNPMLGIGGIIGFYMLLRYMLIPAHGKLAAGFWALIGAIVLAINPMYLQHELSGDAHTAVTCALVWGFYFLVRWADNKKLRDAFIAGLLLGTIPTIRYPDAIMGIGAAFFMIWHLYNHPRPWKHFLAAAAGVMVPLLPLLIRNQLLLGAFWRTGYALTAEQSGFGWSYFTENALPYVRSINDGVGLLFALGLVGMSVMIFRPALPTRDRAEPRPIAIVFLLMALPMLLLYMAYYWGGGGGGTRFLIPTFPFYVAAGVWLAAHVSANMPIAGRVVVACVVIVPQYLWSAQQVSATAARMEYQKKILALVAMDLEKVAKPGDVIVTSNAIGQQLDYVREWKVVDQFVYQGRGPGMQGGPGGAGAGGVEDNGDNEAPSPQQLAKMIERAANYTGDAAQREKKFMADIEKWADGHKIWLVGQEDLLMQYRGPHNDQTGEESAPFVRIAKKVALPEMPEIAMNAGGPGMGRGGRGGAGGGGGRGGRGGAQGPNGQMQGPNMQGGMQPMQGQQFQGNPNFQGQPGPGGQFNGPGMQGDFQGNPAMQGGPGFQGAPGDQFNGPDNQGFNPNNQFQPQENFAPGQGGQFNPQLQGRAGRAGRAGRGINNPQQFQPGMQQLQGQPGMQGQPGPQGGQGPQGRGGRGGGGPGGGGGGGPMNELTGQTEVIIAEWILK